MKTKQLILATVASLAVATSQQLMATSMVTVNYSPYQYSDGGELGVTFTPASDAYSQYYVPGVTSLAANEFQTFCVVEAQPFTPGNAYYYTISSVAQTTVSTTQVLTEGAAYLYFEFAEGILPGYFTASSRTTQAGLLQQAIWYLMGGQVNNNGAFTTPITSNTYYEDAITAFGATGANAAEGSGILPSYGVDVLQLWANANDTGPAQAQLVLTSGVPDGGFTVALLGGAMVSLWGFRRKLS